MPSKKRIPDWKEEFKQRNRRAVRARSAYEANPPTFEERETELLKCLAHYDLDIEERPEPKHRGTASTDEGDSLSMRAKSIVSKLLPRRGVNKGAILRWMRKRFPGICWHEINPVLIGLDHKGKVLAVCGPSPATVRPQRLPEILRAGRYWFLMKSEPIAGHETLSSGANRARSRPQNKLIADAEERIAYWNGIRLKINQSADFTLLYCLYEAAGKLVSYTAILREMKPGEVSDLVSTEGETEASPEVKDAASHVRKAFKAAGVPFKINAVRNRGFQLLPDE